MVIYNDVQNSVDLTSYNDLKLMRVFEQVSEAVQIRYGRHLLDEGIFGDQAYRGLLFQRNGGLGIIGQM